MAQEEHSQEWLAGYGAGYRDALANGKRAGIGNAHELPNALDRADAERFRAFIAPPAENGCWNWIGSYSEQRSGGRGKYPRPRFRLNGRLVAAGRVSMLLFRGVVIPPNMVACHSCDNSSCVNPEHLWVGTQVENMQDAMKKGRLPQCKQTKCSNGHDRTPENTVLERIGGTNWWRKRCKVCRSAWGRRVYQKAA